MALSSSLVRTPGSHPGNTGSNPVRATKKIYHGRDGFFWFQGFEPSKGGRGKEFSPSEVTDPPTGGEDKRAEALLSGAPKS